MTCVSARCVLWPAVLRDISQRGRDLESVLAQYITLVKPAFEEFCLPVSRVVLFSCFFFISSFLTAGPSPLLTPPPLSPSRLDQEVRRRDHPARRRQPW